MFIYVKIIRLYFKIFKIISRIFFILPRIAQQAKMQRTQLRNYRDNKIQQLDINILNRLCYVLECDLHDLIEYIPSEKTQGMTR